MTQAREFDRRTTSLDETSTLAAIRGLSPEDPELRARLDRLVPPFPLKVQIQTSTRCNAACGMCPYPEITSEDGFAHQRMDEALFDRILEQLSGHPVERVSLFLMNEPLLDVRMPELLRRTRVALPSTTLNLFSNGSALTPKTARALAEAGLDELCVSVHGFDRATYEDVMQGLSYERMLRNLDAVLELYDEGALGDLHLQLVTGDLPDLRSSLAGAPERLRRHVMLKAFSNERTAAEVTERLDSSAPRAVQPLCQRPFVKLYVLADGACVLCNVDWRRRVVLGHLGPDGTIADIWNNARYQAIRLAWARRRLPPGHLCERCNYPEVVDD